MFKKALLVFIAVFFVSCSVAHGQISETAKLAALDAQEGDYFGYSVDIDGDYAVVGATYDDDIGQDGGSVYVFHREDGLWIQQQKLIPNFGEANDVFGSSVSIYGDIILIGTHGDDDVATNAGAVYVFKRDGITWTEDTKLFASDGEAGDSLGYSVDFDGEYAVLGAYVDDDNGGDSGSAYIFRFDGVDWTEDTKLLASDGVANDHFGQSVFICGDYAVIGAVADDSYTGSAYIFHREGSTWTEEAKLTASNGLTYDYFGHVVSINGDYAVIGATGTDGYKGSAYVYHRNGIVWTEEAELMASDRQDWDSFGWSLSIDGDYIVIGTHYEDAYVFKRNGTEWTEENKLIPSDFTEDAWFGSAVALDGYNALVGAHRDSASINVAGSAYVFDTFNPGTERISVNLECLPPAGVLPFNVDFYVLLTKHFDSPRTVYAKIRVDLANGTVFDNWKQGTKTLTSFNNFSYHFSATLPRSGSVFGNNVFTLFGEDITPSPYNQPPYPPSGDTDTDACIVMGVQ
ncbi:MAG: FG-GAP repeat protein [bacterium]